MNTELDRARERGKTLATLDTKTGDVAEPPGCFCRIRMHRHDPGYDRFGPWIERAIGTMLAAFGLLLISTKR
jgi:hypothetical protein